MENGPLPKVTIQELIDKYAPREMHKTRKMAACICTFPGHTELSPSLIIADYTFHCFGCGKSGNAVDFVRMLFDISEEAAITKLIADFGNNDKGKVYACKLFHHKCSALFKGRKTRPKRKGLITNKRREK